MFKSKKGFTMVELLVVLVIVAILAAVAAPIYMANVKRSMASDAVAAMALIRQAERENRVKSGSFVEVVDGDLYDTTALGIDLKTVQYFSNDAFGVDITSPDFAAPNTLVGQPDTAVDFVITANGANSVECTSGVTDCAIHADNADLDNMCLQMDNAGRIFVSYDSPDCVGGTWEKY